MLALVLLCVAVLVIGVGVGRPWGWLGGGLAVAALLAATTSLL